MAANTAPNQPAPPDQPKPPGSKTKPPAEPELPMEWAGPGTMFLVTLGWLAVLGVAAGWYVLEQIRAEPLERWLVAEIAWWAGLGGAGASLDSIRRDVAKWNPAANLSYLIRPLTGAVVGTVGYFIYITLAQASIAIGEYSPPKAASWLSLMIAFALGYREEVFRRLLQRVIDLLATAGGADTEPPSAPRVFDCQLKGDTVTLTWSEASDNVAVTGYNVYRNYRFLAAIRFNAGPAPTGHEPPRDLLFEDRHAPAGRLLYSVTAVDAAGNESPAVGPRTVQIPGPSGGG